MFRGRADIRTASDGTRQGVQGPGLARRWICKWRDASGAASAFGGKTAAHRDAAGRGRTRREEEVVVVRGYVGVARTPGNDDDDVAAGDDADDENDAGNVIFRMTLCSALRGEESAVGNGFLF